MGQKKFRSKQIFSQKEIEKRAADKYLWPKPKYMSNYGHFLCISAHVETEMDPPGMVGESRGTWEPGSHEILRSQAKFWL